MYGSVNATDLAANYQWNDLTTLANNTAHYDRLVAIFDEMTLDRPAPEPYQYFGPADHLAGVFPHQGPNVRYPDPVLNDLSRVRCAPVATGHGLSGRTHIRIAMTAMTDERGVNLAKRLKQLYDQGCNIRIIYAMFGNTVLNVLRGKGGRGPIPMRQVAQDFNKDCIYDRYLHTKIMTISGNWNGNPAAEVTWNGSANWTTNSLNSDEVGMRIYTTGVRKLYSGWIDSIFNNPPQATPGVCSPTEGRMAVRTGELESYTVDPYSEMEID